MWSNGASGATSGYIHMALTIKEIFSRGVEI